MTTSTGMSKLLVFSTEQMGSLPGCCSCLPASILSFAIVEQTSSSAVDSRHLMFAANLQIRPTPSLQCLLCTSQITFQSNGISVVHPLAFPVSFVGNAAVILSADTWCITRIRVEGQGAIGDTGMFILGYRACGVLSKVFLFRHTLRRGLQHISHACNALHKPESTPGEVAQLLPSVVGKYPLQVSM